MFRKILFAVSFIALFIPARFVAAQTASAALTLKAEPQIDSTTLTSARLLPLLPLDHTSPIAGSHVDFSWSAIAPADRYRLEVEEANGNAMLSLLLPRGVGIHRMPSSQLDARGDLRWRVVALDHAGKQIAETPWRTLLPLSSICEIL